MKLWMMLMGMLGFLQASKLLLMFANIHTHTRTHLCRFRSLPIPFSSYKEELSELTQLEDVFSFRLTAFLFLTASWLTQITSSWTTTFKKTAALTEYLSI